MNNEMRRLAEKNTGPFGSNGRTPRTPLPWEVMEVVIKRAKNACESCGTRIKKLTTHHLIYNLKDVTHDPADEGKDNRELTVEALHINSAYNRAPPEAGH